MSRPRGEIHLALAEALQRVQRATRKALYRWLVRTGYPVSMRSVRMTLENMVRYGHVEIVERVRVPWSCKPICKYALAQERCATDGNLLASVMAGWGRLPAQ